MISTQRADRQLVRADALAHAVVRAPRRRCPAPSRGPASRSRANTSCRRQPGDVAHVRDLHRRVRVEVEVAAPSPWRAAASPGSPRAPSRGGCPTACRSRSRRSRPPRASRRDEVLAVVLVGVGRALALTPKPQNAQPTMQTLETLMLRLTTKVTVSPASSARSSSAAWRMSSIASGRVSANSAVSSSAASALAVRGRARSCRRGPSARGAGPRRGMKLAVTSLDHVEHARGEPLGVDVLRVDAQPLGQRDAVLRQPLAHLVRATGTGARARCGRRWRDRPPRSVAPAATSSRPPVGQVRRHLDADARASAAAPRRPAASCPRSVTGDAHAGRRRRRGRRPARCASSARRRSVAISAGSSP